MSLGAPRLVVVIFRNVKIIGEVQRDALGKEIVFHGKLAGWIEVALP